MQYRMEAGLRKYLSCDVNIINYASYRANIIVKDDSLTYDTDIYGMWDVDRYVNLLMGEIPRLTDDANGYGPNGKGFIAHVDISNRVLKAFNELKNEYGQEVRCANPLYASN